ncbi:dehydrogenase [Gordonia jinghuaiqii]|uniref:Acyl-CoA dehydrogenase family protein n=2 Tax=Gordonia jinghuaiqii TaxID=2758710 RepID=A0A7D7LV29_9ACTN|nr:dehydrogenase [Gordonia jinghuaiqii]QMT03760.1 acyl-CoA dehydrogenase family protein [Gordonia jinghuaiqii]
MERGIRVTKSVDISDLAGFRAKAAQWLAETAPEHGWLKTPDGSRRRVGAGDHEAVERNRECQRLLFEAGFAGISWPTEYGGQGLSLREQIVFNEEAGAYDLPLVVYIIGLGMCGPTILAAGTEEQKRRYIEPMLRGDEVWCQLFSEPGAGSDVAGLSSKAVLDGDEWVLNGQKVWTSGAHHCEFGIVLARTDVNVPKHKGLTMFILDLRSAGVTVRPIRQIDGGEHFNEVFFDDVRIPAENVLGGVGRGWQTATTTLMNERVSLGAVRPMDDVHSAQALIDLAAEQGLSADESIRARLADLWMRESVVGLLGKRITATILSGRQPGPEGSVAKLVRTDYSNRAAEFGFALAGAAGAAWREGAPQGDSFVNTLLFVPTLSVAGGTDEVLKNIIGERVLGLPKEPQVDRDVPFSELKDR